MWTKRAGQVAAFSLVELIFALALSSMIISGIYTQFSGFYKALGGVSIDVEIAELAAYLSKRVNCDVTLKSINVLGGGGDPPATQQIQLLDRSGTPILKSHDLGGEYAPYRRISSDWFASVTWTGSSLAVSVAKKGKSSHGWAKNPVTGEEINFFSSKTQLYRDQPAGMSMCPRSSQAGVLEQQLSTTSDVINPFIGAPVSQLVGVTLLTPAGGNKACHLYCVSRNYVAGRIVSGADGYSQNDANGNFVRVVFFPAGKSLVNCGCFL